MLRFTYCVYHLLTRTTATVTLCFIQLSKPVSEFPKFQHSAVLLTLAIHSQLRFIESATQKNLFNYFRQNYNSTATPRFERIIVRSLSGT